MHNKKVNIEVFDNEELFAEDDETPIKLVKDDAEVTKLENITIDDTGKAIVKVKLRPKSDEDYKKLKDKFKDDKVAKLYLKITCIGNDKNHEKKFLDGDEFEVKKGKLLFPFKKIPLNHPDGFKNKDYKIWDYTLSEKNYATFGYKRGSNRIHAARDLYYDGGEPIYSIYDGVVKNVYAFYLDTWAIEIEHDYEYKSGYKLYVRYGEVDKKDILVKTGDKVIRGQQIAKVGLLYNKVKKTYVIQPSPDKRGMLHIEMYTGEATGKLTDKTVKYSDMMYATSSKFSKGRSFQRRKDLFDPQDLLKEGYTNSKNEGLIK